MCKHLLIAGVALVLTGGVAQAAPVTATTGDLLIFEGGTNAEGLQNLDQTGTASTAPITRTLSGLTPGPVGDVTVTFTAAGDFDSDIENIALAIDGVDLGVFLNSDPDDDLFDNASFGDIGFFNAAETRSASASVDLSAALADGMLDFVFTFGLAVNVSDGDFLRVDVEYSTHDTTRVPLPATAPLLLGAIALGGFVLRRRG
ncbi:MAG: hypothetical protein ACFBSD_12295 [Paracoccaceae bacterium]